MAIRPQCAKMALSFNKETTYGTAVLAANINKKYALVEPSLLEPDFDRVDDTALIKGHEFPADVSRDIITAQSLSIPFSFNSNLSLIGLMFALMTGVDSVVDVTPGIPTGVDFKHTYKAQDLCLTDQPPSTTWVLGLTGDTASNIIASGLIPNELRIAVENRGFLPISGTAFSDGSMVKNTTFAFPAAFSDADVVVGKMLKFEIANAGVALVDKSSIIRGFDFSLNNNLDVDDDKNQVAAGLIRKQLRPGTRSVALTATVVGHQGDAFWLDFESGQEKDVQLSVVKTAPDVNGEGGRQLVIRARSTKISQIRGRFDGIRDVLDITFKLFFNVTDSSPYTVEVRNGDAAYLL